MRKDISIMTTSSRRTYVRPLITAVVPADILLQSASPIPEAPVKPEPGEEALSKKIVFDIWQEEEDDDTPTSAFTFNY